MSRMTARSKNTVRVEIPSGQNEARIKIGVSVLSLTNLDKLFWARPAITKRDLLQYYSNISDILLPHLVNRAIVMKRYPNGAGGDFFFQKTNSRTA